MALVSGLEGTEKMSELEKNLKEIEDKMFQCEQNFESALRLADLEYGEQKALSSVYNGIEAVYKQNQVLIEQNQEIINYLKEQKK